jgi:hypothetical protein
VFWLGASDKANHYYETEPLPNRGGWYAHQLPAGVQKFPTAATLVLETAVPFLVFAPRRPRQLAFALLGALRGWQTGSARSVW